MLTLAAALAELAELTRNGPTTINALTALAARVSVDAPGSITVFYGGDLPDGSKARAAVQAMSDADPNVRVLVKTASFEFLDSTAFIRAYLDAYGAPDVTVQQFRQETFSHPAKTQLNHPDNGPWADASRRFAAATTGEVRFLAHRGDLSRTFARTELTALLQSSSATTIEGIPIDELRRTYSEQSLNETFRRVRHVAELNIAASGISRSGLADYFHPQLMTHDVFVASNPAAMERIKAYWNGTQLPAPGLDSNALSPAELAERRSTHVLMRSTAEGTRLGSNGRRVLSGLGAAAAFASFTLAATEAEAAHAAGDNDRAREIMRDWAAESAGSGIGAFVGAKVAGIGLAAVAAAGVTLSAPLAGALVLGAVFTGGLFGGQGGVDFARLLGDRDNNRRADVLDRLANLLFGARTAITTPLPADLDGARLTIDATLTPAEIVVAARNSIAWRYALRELNAFVVTDVEYTRHNADGSLDLYDPATGAGMTEQYLADRAAMLNWKLRYDAAGARDDDDPVRTGGKPYNEEWDTATVQGNWDYVDLGIAIGGNSPLTLAIDGAGLSLHERQVVFGSSAGESILGEGEEGQHCRAGALLAAGHWSCGTR